jgi:hypothetical protein
MLIGLVMLLSTACAFTNVLSERFSSRPTEQPTLTSTTLPATPQPTPAVVVEQLQPFYQSGDRVRFPADALQQLNSYRSQLKLRSTGQMQDEQEVVTQLEVLEERIRADDAAHNRIRGDLVGGADNGTIAFYRFNDRSFSYIPEQDNTCMLFDSQGNEAVFSGALVPHEIFKSFVIEKLVTLDDDANGIPAQRYSVKAVELTLGTVTVTTGEVWIAQQGQFVVRFNGEASGSFALSAPISDGNLSWQYDLSEPNTLAEIELPSACQEQQAAAEFPIPDNATNRTIFNGFISFESPDSALSVARFYRDRLPQDGWQITTQETFDDFYQISVEKGGRSMQISITGVGGGAAVVVVEE